MKKYRQLTFQEMTKIEAFLEAGWKVSDICIKLQRHKTTIYRCIKAGGTTKNFSSQKAFEIISQRKSNKKSHPRILSESLLEKFILSKIECFWLPEQIAGRWKQKTGEPLSHETIYQFIYAHHPNLVKLHFRRKGKKYQKRRKEKYQIQDRRMINERPKEIEKRKRFGDFEGNTIVGKNY